MTNDQAKARLKEMRRHEHEMGPWPDNKTTQALDLALWWAERESGIAKVLGYYGANIDETDVLQAIDEVVEWEKQHPRPGS